MGFESPSSGHFIFILMRKWWLSNVLTNTHLNQFNAWVLRLKPWWNVPQSCCRKYWKNPFRQFREMAVWPISDYFPPRLGVSWRWEKENRVALQDWYWVWQYDVSPQWWTFHGENDEICHPFLGTPDKSKAIKPSRPIWICKSAEPWSSHDIFP